MDTVVGMNTKDGFSLLNLKANCLYNIRRCDITSGGGEIRNQNIINPKYRGLIRNIKTSLHLEVFDSQTILLAEPRAKARKIRKSQNQYS
jgi:hypothetical protein